MGALRYDILHRDTSSHARLGRVTTPHGTFDTPAFMPVGTQGTVKGLLPADVWDTGSQIILANTYHLMLRPGSELVASMGGLQQWTRWGGPMLTDSGGYQVFSLADLNRIDDEGVTFKSHLDGSTIELTPARSMQVQNQLGADIIMAFDDCPPAAADLPHNTDPGIDPRPAYLRRVQIANERTARWLDACVKAHARPDEQALFGIVQGGTDPAARDWCVQQVCSHDLPGFAIGGVAVGESPDELVQIVAHTAPQMPQDKPRYLMGVGYARDIVAAVRAGVDMFDCVLPTRNGRNATAFTRTGQIKLRNAAHKDDPSPIEAGCDCLACAGKYGELAAGRAWAGGAGFSRSYIRHLFLAGEMLGPILVSLHNIRHFQRLMLDIRAAIQHNDWSFLARQWPVAALVA
jgi:queuine tRNA-ribosyltransferase